MSGQISFYDEDTLLDRLIHDYKADRDKAVFLIGSGVTSRGEGRKGVSDVAEVINLVRDELSGDERVLNQLNEEIGANPALGYQAAFRTLFGRRKPACANRIVRQAVVEARSTQDPYQKAREALRNVDIEPDECKRLCELLEKDVHHWDLRPGVEALGQIATEFYGCFGELILTTNFDPLIKVSIWRAGGNAESVVPGDSFNLPISDTDTSRIIHLHGDWGSVDTLHTRALLEQDRPGLEIGLSKLLAKKVVVVIGYGGWDDVFTRTLIRSHYDPMSPTNVLWTFYQTSQRELEDRYVYLFQRLLGGVGANRVPLYKGIDADTFFPRLLDRLRTIRRAESGTIVSTEPKQSSSVSLEAPAENRPGGAAKTPVQQLHSARLSDGEVIEDSHLFIASLEKLTQDVTRNKFVDEKTALIQEPNFLLFEREGRVVMAIVPGNCRVDEYCLQKTSEPQTKSSLITPDHVKRLGFHSGGVHPMFRDPQDLICRIVCDGTFLVQAVLCGESKMALPVYNSDGSLEKVIAPLGAIFKLLEDLHGPDKVTFANIGVRADQGGAEPILRRLIRNRPYNTRFAPTPSSLLHLGNARTAFAAYLLNLKDRSRSRFYLRIDNTDIEKARDRFVKDIKRDLRWLGLEWDDESSFKQTDAESSEIYENLLRVLEKAGLTQRDADGAVWLKSLPEKNYCSVYFDWREGPVVTHQPPLTRKKQERKVRLFRGNEGNAFYAYAGLIDDIRALSTNEHITYVVRDNRQRELTQKQAHIRVALELARQRLQGDPDVELWFSESGMDVCRPIPLPVYFHVPIVTDNGELEANKSEKKRSPDNEPPQYTVLSKRNDAKDSEKQWLEQYRLEYLRSQSYLPESVAAYLVSTILPAHSAQGRWKTHLEKIAGVFSQLGVDSGLHFFSQILNLDDLVRSQNPIHCDLHRIDFAEQVILRQTPLWRLKQILKQRLAYSEKESFDVNSDLVERIRVNSKDFASLSQIRAVLNKPRTNPSLISPTTVLLLERAINAGDDCVREIRLEVSNRREKLAKLSDDQKQREFKRLRRLLGDLRLILTGAETSPKIEVLLSIVGNTEAASRIRAFLEMRNG